MIGLLSLLMIVNCGKKTTQIDEELRVKVDRGELYVRVKGNPNKPILLNLHGGPGGFSAFEILLMDPYFQNDHLVAYLDQRGCGKSSAITDTTLLTIEQYVQDLDIVIDTLLNRFDRKKVNLYGNSWGAAYGFLYLLEDFSRVNAFTSVGANINQKYKYDFLINFEKEMANELVESDIPEKQKNKLLKVLVELERIEKLTVSDYPMEDYLLTQRFPAQIGFSAFFADPNKRLPVEDILKNETKMQQTGYTLEEFYQSVTRGETVKKAFQKQPAYFAMYLKDELEKIEIPVLIIQGEGDYIVGPQQAQNIYDGLTSVDENDKELHILPNVGHSPIIEAPEKLIRIVNDFFEKHEIK